MSTNNNENNEKKLKNSGGGDKDKIGKIIYSTQVINKPFYIICLKVYHCPTSVVSLLSLQERNIQVKIMVKSKM